MIDLSILRGLSKSEKSKKIMLIAEEYANNTHGRKKETLGYANNDIYNMKWNTCFHNKLDELKMQAGLLKWKRR